MSPWCPECGRAVDEHTSDEDAECRANWVQRRRNQSDAYWAAVREKADL